MRKKRETESDADRSARIERQARDSADQAAAEDREIDAAIRRSIKYHGA